MQKRNFSIWLWKGRLLPITELEHTLPHQQNEAKIFFICIFANSHEKHCSTSSILLRFTVNGRLNISNLPYIFFIFISLLLQYPLSLIQILEICWREKKTHKKERLRNYFSCSRPPREEEKIQSHSVVIISFLSTPFFFFKVYFQKEKKNSYKQLRSKLTNLSKSRVLFLPLRYYPPMVNFFFYYFFISPSFQY